MATKPHKNRSLVADRPAESAGVAAALGLLLARLLGVNDVDTIVAIGIVVGALPAAVTYTVNRLPDGAASLRKAWDTLRGR